jgi:hypothetical protein
MPHDEEETADLAKTAEKTDSAISTFSAVFSVSVEPELKTLYSYTRLMI